MSDLRLTLACGPYDRMEALWNGKVKPKGIELDYQTIMPPEVFDRMIDKQEFEIAEMGSSRHIARCMSGRWPFVGLPVFPSKMFRHGYIFINRKSGIAKPTDLAGKRIGVPLYGMTAAIWIRGQLAEHYGVDLSQVKWFRGGLYTAESPDDNSTRGANVPVKIEFIGRDRTLDAMLAAGELDAVIGAEKAPSFGKHPDVARLFANPRAEERDYWRKTQIHPIMHMVVIREDVYRKNPWIAASMFDAFERAKKWAMDMMRMNHAQRVMLPWLYDDLDEIDELFGGDPWSYGVEPNRKTLETLIRNMTDQGLLLNKVTVDQLFAPVEGLKS